MSLRPQQAMYNVQPQYGQIYPQYQTIPIPLMKPSSSLPGLGAVREEQRHLETFAGNSTASTLSRKAPYYYTDLYPSKSSSIFDSNLNIAENGIQNRDEEEDDDRMDAASIKSTNSSVKKLVQKYNSNQGQASGPTASRTNGYISVRPQINSH